MVEVTDGTAEYNADHFRINVFYDLAKTSVIRMAWGLAQELTDDRTAVALTPGWMRSEEMLEHYGVTEENWRDGTQRTPHFCISESPRFVGRAVAALAGDPDRHRWNGQSLSSGGLAQVYGFTDLDGTRPDCWRYMTEVVDNPDASPGRRGLPVNLHPIGVVESPLTDRATAPKQGDEGAPEATLVIDERYAEALDGIAPGDELLVLTWLDRAHRDVLRVHPRGDLSRAEQGVFNTRSPDRPNPIGLHRVTVEAIDGLRLRVGNLEALDGTPIVDIKPPLRDER